MEDISGSKAERVRQCPASAVLPHVTTTAPKPSAVRGQDIHTFLETVRALGFDAAIAAAPADLQPYLAAIDVDALPTNLATEVAFAWDWKLRRGRELGRNLGRDYNKANPPLGPTEDPLTVDVIGVADLVGYVGDYKTGRTRYPPPDRFAQTLLGALCARDVFRLERVRLELIYIDYDGDDYRSSAVADDWILDDFADEWAAARELVHVYDAEVRAGRPVPLREGDHCEFCPAFKHCAAKTALVRQLPVEVDVMLHDRPGGVIPRERMAAMWHRCEQLKDLIGAIQSEICMAAAREPIDLGNGTILGTITTDREFLVGKVAASVLEQWHGKDAADEAIEISMSKDALRKAVAARRKPNEKISTKKEDGVLDLILAEIRRRGGIERTVTTNIKPHSAKRALRGGGAP